MELRELVPLLRTLVTDETIDIEKREALERAADLIGWLSTDVPGGERPRHGERAGRPWTREEDRWLYDGYFMVDLPIDWLAFEHERSEGAIRTRLERLGLREKRGPAADARFMDSVTQGVFLPGLWSRRVFVRFLRGCLLDRETAEATRLALSVLVALDPEISAGRVARELAEVRAIMEASGPERDFHAFAEAHPELGARETGSQ